jgi:peptidoglycan/LPS O-acetylase OafA/YrhL
MGDQLNPGIASITATGSERPDRTVESDLSEQGSVPPFSLGNRPALTGIRAIGVSLVLIFHSNFQTLPGSWIVLGVFFVLSGFLITTMLGSEHQRTGRISLGRFYSRRAVRLLPPLFLTVALLAVYAWFVHVADAGQRIWGDSAAALFYYADYRQAFEHNPLYSGYLTQCWSLAVEEQFYLIWAALLLVALKFGRRKLAYAMAFTGIVACTLNRTLIVLTAPHWSLSVADRVYYPFDTRADALFLGCLLGLLATGGRLDNWPTNAQRALSVAAVAATATMVWILFSVSLGLRSLPLVWLPVSEVASAVIIVYLVVRPSGLGTKVVGLSALVLVGNMSYTIYLIHWPIFVAISPTTVGWPYWELDVVRMAIVIPIAVASWYLMERPLTRWRRRALEVQGPAQTASLTAPIVPSRSSRPTASGETREAARGE